MAFELDHWRNPRATIANDLRHNDLAYVTHGALQVGVALRILGRLPSPLTTLLDYGCGTGRIGRCATSIWKDVYGYDPVPECITVGMKEALPLTVRNLHLTSDWSKVPECDYGISVNVMEHLDVPAQELMIEHLRAKVRGHTVIWYRPASNGQTLARWLTDKQRRQDEKSPASIQVVSVHLRA